MKSSEVAAAINEVSTQLTKAQGEIVAKIAELEASLNDVELPAEATDALAALKAKVQTLDDVVPDVTEPPTTG